MEYVRLGCTQISNICSFCNIKAVFFLPLVSRFSILASTGKLALHLCIFKIYLTFDICHNATRPSCTASQVPTSYIVGRNLTAPWYLALCVD